jgi:hypothetical protein
MMLSNAEQLKRCFFCDYVPVLTAMPLLSSQPRGTMPVLSSEI